MSMITYTPWDQWLNQSLGWVRYTKGIICLLTFLDAIKCYIALRLTFKPFSTPPYLFIIFALSSVLVSCVDFGRDVSSADLKSAVVDVLAMIVPGTFAWLAGTLPLMPYRPSLNVAQLNDVWIYPHSSRWFLTRESTDTVRYTVMSWRWCQPLVLVYIYVCPTDFRLSNEENFEWYGRVEPFALLSPQKYI